MPVIMAVSPRFDPNAVASLTADRWRNRALTDTYEPGSTMGDVGSLPLGAALGTVAVISKHELLLLMVGGVFVIEAVSVIFQVASFKSRGKRIFLMAPIHHHFEMKGWEEPKVVVRLWIIAILLALLSLSTLKLR